MTCDQELWPGGLRCNKPAGHEGGCVWAKGVELLSLDEATGITEHWYVEPMTSGSTTTVGIPADVLLDEVRLERA